MSASPCCYCGRMMSAARPKPRNLPRMSLATRDHVLPRVRGGTFAADNIRICCWRCNELRGALGHCTGALACFLACLPKLKTPEIQELARVWRASSPLFAKLPK